ncbi:MAG: hypothetical protein EPO68_04720, partial [Planctomycetota bacterium]
MLARSFLAVSFLASSSFAGVLHVGPVGSGHPFTDIQPAIDAAQPGDTIRVHAGTYTGFDVHKPLAILGDGSALVTVHEQGLGLAGFSHARASGVASSATLALSGMRFEFAGSPAVPATPLVRLEQCAGALVLDDLDLRTPLFGSTGGLRAEHCDWVIGRGLVLLGSVNGSGAALTAVHSTLWLSASDLHGGAAWFVYGGSQALRLEDAVAYVASSRLTGGDGGYGSPTGAPGKQALLAVGASVMKLVGGPNAVVQGGKGGLGGWFDGPKGLAVHVADASEGLYSTSVGFAGTIYDPAGALDALPIVYPTLTLDSAIAAPGAGFQVHAQGNAGNPCALFLAPRLASAPFALAGIDGAVALDAAQAVLFAVKPLDASGKADF